MIAFFPLTPNTPRNSSKFQRFLDERAYWNGSVAPAPCPVQLLTPIFVTFIACILPFVKDKVKGDGGVGGSGSGLGEGEGGASRQGVKEGNIRRDIRDREDGEEGRTI